MTSIMRRDFLTADRAEMLETIFRRLAECECHTVPVLHDGRLIGRVTMGNMGEYFLIQAAIKKNDPKALAPNGVPRHCAA